MKTVTIVQRRLTHYRVALFERLKSTLQPMGIRLRLLHGVPAPSEISKADGGFLEWAEPLPTRYLWNERVCWQPFFHAARQSDLIIVTQENKLVHNLPLILRSPHFRPMVAFWGHGRNMQAVRPDTVAERFKRWTTRRVDWWFAYTEMSARFVQGDGFPASRITVLNNSIDTAELRGQVAQARERPQSELRRELGVRSGPLGLFLGSLYEEKRIAFLLEAARMLQAQIPSFELLIAGDGPLRGEVQTAAQARPYVHYLGPARGPRKAELLVTADIMLNPGLVGLGILDALVAGLPMATTDCGLHSPEIAYLRDGHNGLMTSNALDVYVERVRDVLARPELRATLAENASQSGREYSIEDMTQRFAHGILDCLCVAGRHE